DDQIRKIIRSRNIIFNDKVMDRVRLGTRDDGVYPEIKTIKEISLNDILVDKKKTNNGQEDQEAVTLAVDS
ncbi:hypothetical protein PanWU01x14_008490, partial [Parasponia andersonii]